MFVYLQQIGLLVLSVLNAAFSAACTIGLLLAISLTVAHNGQGLMIGCNDTEVPVDARSPVSARCPFDTTRIYVSFKKCLYLASIDPYASFFYPVGLCFLMFLPLGPPPRFRTPPWPCGSHVLLWLHLRWACLCGASS